MSFSKGYTAIKVFERSALSQDSKIRDKIASEITKHAKPLFKLLNLDSDMALLAIRIKQGDFYIIEDKAQYLLPMLPTPQIRKLAMGMCGALSSPIKYQNKINYYPPKHQYMLTFEGALELIADTLGINPLVARLVTFDMETYQAIEDRYKFPKQAV